MNPGDDYWSDVICAIKVFKMSIKGNVFSLFAVGLMSRVFANGPGDQGSLPGRVIPKTQKVVLDAALLSTKHYKVKIRDKVELSREWSSAIRYTSV